MTYYVTLLLLFLSFSLAHQEPTPVRPFTVASFELPFPPNASNSVTGLNIYASGGFFWASKSGNLPTTGCGLLGGSQCPAGTETVFWVDRDGRAFLNSANPQQVYIDTSNGVLSYLTSMSTPPNTYSPGANVANFVHLGYGTNLTTPIPGADPNKFVNAGPGSLNWLGSENSDWFLCPGKGNSTKYQVQKQVTVNTPDQADCLSGIALIAIDYSGPFPAAGLYL